MQSDDVESMLIRLADRADALSLPVWQRGDMQIEIKPDGSPVTTTDVAVETEVRAQLAQVFPADGFCGEEVGETAGTSGRTWIVDGIDGTRAFTTAQAGWSTLIALVVDDEPIAGMVTSPALERRWYVSPRGHPIVVAARGTPQKLAVSNCTSISVARVIVWPFLSPVKPAFRDRADQIRDLVLQDPLLRPSLESAVPNGAMLVAEGRVDAFVMFGGQAWDHAASAAVVQASGGCFTCLDGTSSLWAGSGVYTNGHLHQQLLDRL